ncbi:hypothetical protein GC105_10980 [Alkalibaculum sp. M08DMB]|uniref:Penicillin-binding protein transpeptidase domain-containing protein n=1 Tax=Alkalibaculum sporogenes TaxID=2655001 RepID=A0A6A7KAC7_9FIRM|nr:penicillin-binding transpeptidase domain-containing protein [Alkalibaculum sporogenes]MPW26312.1 hypothetical protein [Alkalibaculum sporogenes]
MRKKRIVFVSMMFLVAFFSISLRTGYLLVNDNKVSIDRITNQVSSNSFLYYPRGEITDRNGIILSGKVVDKELPIKDYNAIIAKDVIGHLSTDEGNTTSKGIKGVSGLQQLYDTELNGGIPIKIAMYSDAKGENIFGESALVYGDHLNEGSSLVTTLDYHIQNLVETEISSINKQKGYPGIAVVVSDVASGDILAMASNGDETNKSLLSFQPGSVFKTLVIAKALEDEKIDIDTMFKCNGHIDIDGTTKHCSKSEGHGEISLKDAFAQSCNIVAYEVAMMLNQEDDNENIIYNDVLNLAKEFGFQDDTVKSMKEFPISYDYSYPSIPTRLYNKMDVFNLALGQGKVMASPLTMTKILATIANDGTLIEPRIVLSQTHPLGDQIIYETDRKQIFSKEVNDKLKILLEEVCKTGTGEENSLIDLGGLAGKSGTAQHISDRENHGWFAGYFPANEPKYAMTVLVEEGGTSSDTALPIFDKIAVEILKLYPEN